MLERLSETGNDEQIDLGPLRVLQAQLAARELKPAEIASTWAHRAATNKADNIKKALAKAEANLQHTGKQFKLAQENYDKMLEETADAEEECESMLRGMAAALPGAGQAQADDVWKIPKVDPDFFNMEDYEEADRESLQKFKTKDMEELEVIVSNAGAQYKAYYEVKKKADAIHAAHKAKKRKASEG